MNLVIFNMNLGLPLPSFLLPAIKTTGGENPWNMCHSFDVNTTSLIPALFLSPTCHPSSAAAKLHWQGLISLVEEVFALSQRKDHSTSKAIFQNKWKNRFSFLPNHNHVHWSHVYHLILLKPSLCYNNCSEGQCIGVEWAHWSLGEYFVCLSQTHPHSIRNWGRIQC